MAPPPVSYLLAIYEQEPYVRAAVRSALAQDYQPLEIIVSDDASRDASFDVVKEEVERYRGPHRVVLNRNPENLHLAHTHRLLELAKGRFVIRAHGDDIARPDRTRRLVEAWVRQSATLVTSNAAMITAAGEPLGPLSSVTRSGWVKVEHLIHGGNLRTTVGATFAADRAVYERFPRADPALYPPGMDHIIPFRACLFSGIYYLGEQLLRYRQHGRSMSSLMVDRTGGRTALDETTAAHNVWAQLCRLDELAAFRGQGPDQPRLAEIQRLLEERIASLTRLWVGYRDQLKAEGLRLAWLDPPAFEQRTLKRELILAPKTDQPRR